MNFRRLTLAGSFTFLLVVPAWAQDAAALSAIQSGNKLVAQQRYELAIREYARVVDSDDETYAQSLYNIGVCYYELWQTQEAIEFYKRAIKLKHGNYSRASFALGIALEDQNDLTQAKEAYLLSIRTSRDGYPWAKFKLGLLAVNKGDFKSAANFFREASRQSGEHAPASHNNLGVTLARMGRLNEAEREFVIALAQTNGVFSDADHNLKLCRWLKIAAENGNAVRDLKLSERVGSSLNPMLLN